MAADPAAPSLEPFLSGLDKPVNLESSGLDGDGRLFIVQQGGKILIVNPNGTIRATPFLDITGRVDQTTGRAGLFGLAFHPDYGANGLFFIYYIHLQDDTYILRLSRFQVTDDPNVADPGSENILLTVSKSEAGHNAGDLHFGPDSYLYFPLGDGDSGLITERPQDPTTLLGKMSRINVDDKAGEGAAECKGQGSGDYSIPPTNPFAGLGTSACDEVWATGLRNPWRFSFDRQTGDLYLSDVGEAEWDELNFQAAGAAGGKNYGWPCYEAGEVFEQAKWPERGCDEGATFTFPVVSLKIGAGGDCSIIGGFVYRGSRYSDLVGRYFMADYCSGRLRDAVRDGGNWDVTLHDETAPFGVVSFGQGNDGELYVVNRDVGAINHLVGEEGPVTPTSSPTPSSTPPPGSTATATPTATPTLPPGTTATPTPTATAATPSWTDQHHLPAVFNIQGIDPTPTIFVPLTPP